MTTLLTILIPTLPVREKYLQRLLNILLPQVTDLPVEISIDADTSCQIGRKRNNMMATAHGEYVAWIDDDDRISENYINLVLAGIFTLPTHCSLVGEITFDGKKPKPFYHSTDYDTYWEDEKGYYRHPNHLNTIRRDLAIQVPFPDWQLSEDTNFAVGIKNKGLLTNEYKIPEMIYYYDYITDKERHDYTL